MAEVEALHDMRFGRGIGNPLGDGLPVLKQTGDRVDAVGAVDDWLSRKAAASGCQHRWTAPASLTASRIMSPASAAASIVP